MTDNNRGSIRLNEKFYCLSRSKPDKTLLIKGTKPSGPVSQSFMCTVVVLLVLNTYLTTSSLFSSSIPAPIITISMTLLFFSKTCCTAIMPGAAKYSASFIASWSRGGTVVRDLPTSNIFYMLSKYNTKIKALNLQPGIELGEMYVE